MRDGSHAGLRGLPREEDLARELILTLQPDQRRMAQIAVEAPGDIASRWVPVAALPEAALRHPICPAGPGPARALRVPPPPVRRPAASAVANQAWTDITDAGLDQVASGGLGRYSRVPAITTRSRGPSLLIEYDNTQDQANHIHSVWRDLRRDFGGDLLAQHYAGVRH